MEVVINVDFGGFGVSSEVMQYLIDNKSDAIILMPVMDADHFNKYTSNYNDYGCIKATGNSIYVLKSGYDIRTNKDLIKAVKIFGKAANGKYASLKIVEIPDDISWFISVDDGGREHVSETHRTWR